VYLTDTALAPLLAFMTGAIPNAAAGSTSGLPIKSDLATAAEISAVTAGIPKNTALAKFAFVMRDSSTHLPVAGKSVTVTRSIDGAAFAAGTLSAVTGLANGVYLMDWGSADLNGKVITLRATASGCDDTFMTLVTSG
jgi:hypothetical protein